MGAIPGSCSPHVADLELIKTAYWVAVKELKLSHRNMGM